MEQQPTRRGRPRKTEGPETRERLLSAALELFADKGFAATSVREIADAVGIRDSAIYAHFDGKQALLDTLMAQAGPGVLGAVGFDPQALASLSPASALPALFGRIVQQWSEPPVRKFTSMLLRDGGDKVAAALDIVVDRLAPLFAAWQDAGHFAPEPEARFLAWEAIAPLATIRLMHMSSTASPQQLDTARQLAERHVAHFLAVHLKSGV